jgi:hypothetical protein
MKKIIPIDHMEKTYINPILNQIVRSLCTGLAIPNDFIVRQNFLNRDGVKDWNSGKLSLRPIEGNRNTIEFVANTVVSDGVRGMEMREDTSLLTIPKYNLSVKPIRVKKYVDLTIKVSSISRATIENLLNSLNYKKSVSSVYMLNASGTYHLPEYVTNLMGEINSILNNKRSQPLTVPDFIGRNAIDGIKVVTNLSDKTDGIVMEENLENISMNIHTETMSELNEDVEASIYHTTFVVGIDMSHPMAFEMIVDNIICGEPLPSPYNNMNPLVEHYENYAYYMELITELVDDGTIEGIKIDWECVDGIIQEGPFKTADLDNDFTGTLDGVYVNGVIYGGLADGMILSQSYFGNMNWEVENGIVQEGDLKGIQLEAPYETLTGIVKGVYVDGRIYGGEMHGLNVNGDFSVESIDGVIQNGLFIDTSIPFPNVGYTGNVTGTIEKGKVINGMLEGKHLSNLSYEIFSWSVDKGILLTGPFNGKDISDIMGENYFGTVKGELSNFTVTSGPLIGMTSNGYFDVEAKDGYILEGLFKDTLIPNNTAFTGRVTGTFKDGTVYDGIMDGYQIDVETFKIVNLVAVDGIINGGDFNNNYMGYDFTGEFEGVLVKRTLFAEYMNGKTLMPRLGGVVIDDIVVGGVLDGMYTVNPVEDFSSLLGRYENERYYDDLLETNVIPTLEETIKSNTNNEFDKYYESLHIESRLEKPNRLLNIPFYDLQDGYLVDDYEALMSILLSVDDDRRFCFNLGDLGLYNLAKEFLEILRLGNQRGIFERRRFPLLLEIYKDGVLMMPGEFFFNQDTLDIVSLNDMDTNSTYRVFIFVLLDYDVLRYSFSYPWKEVFVLISEYFNLLKILYFKANGPDGEGGVLVKHAHIKHSNLSNRYGWQSSVTIAHMEHKGLISRI